MFDSIGRHDDDEAVARTATASSLVILMLATITCGIGGLFALTVQHVIEEGVPIDVIELFEVEEPTLAMKAPRPPALKGTPDAKPTEPVDPDEMTKDPILEPIDDINKPPIVTAKRPPGTDDGHDNGDPRSTGPGTIGGTCEGPNCPEVGPTDGCAGPDCGDAVEFHRTEVTVKRRAELRYPAEARALGITNVTCRARVTIDEGGRPLRVDVSGCPEVFHASTRKGVMRWRWRPAKVDGAPVRGRFTLTIHYNLDG
jgi:TonB family protein